MPSSARSDTSEDMPPTTPPTVEQRFSSPGFLLANVGHAVSELFARDLAPLGLKPQEAAILLVLREAGPIKQQELAQTLSLDANTIVLMLNSLEYRGLVVRQRDPQDRRRHVVTITESGRHLRADADRIVEHVEQTLVAQLDAEHQRVLRHALRTIDQTLGYPRRAVGPGC
ncbi:MAG: MarR family transcriptional regulator [Gordonia sp. (in: high G+C Gram-positive bacteria)]